MKTKDLETYKKDGKEIKENKGQKL